MVTYESAEEVGMTIFTPVIAVMYVVVICLALLLAFGFITESGAALRAGDTHVGLWLLTARQPRQTKPFSFCYFDTGNCKESLQISD